MIALAVSLLATDAAYAQFRPDPKMLAMLPPYCRHSKVYIEHVPGGNNPVEIERWKRVLGESNWHHIHHYCFGLEHTNSVLFKRLSKQERNHRLSNSIAEFDYVILRVRPDFALLPEILTKRGENLMRLGREPEAIVTLMRAIETKPDYWPPYASLSDHYEETGEIKQARAWLEKGLTASPGATALQTRLRELSASAAR
jgi:tetratricopeptide (TPR) repeat protein